MPETGTVAGLAVTGGLEGSGGGGVGDLGECGGDCDVGVTVGECE